MLPVSLRTERFRRRSNGGVRARCASRVGRRNGAMPRWPVPGSGN